MNDLARDDDILTPPEQLASRLIDLWCAEKGRQMPWATAVEITAIVTKMPDLEMSRLLALADEPSPPATVDVGAMRRALTEYPDKNPQQSQAHKVCAGVLKLAASYAGEER